MLNTMPTYDELFKPVLDYLSKQTEVAHRSDIENAIINELNLSEELLNERLQSGQIKIYNRIGWAITTLLKTQLIDRPKRANYVITEEGKKFNKAHESFTLKQLPVIDSEEYRIYMFGKNYKNDKQTETYNPDDILTSTPEEIIQHQFNTIDQNLKSELLEELKKVNPYYFEEIIVDLVVAMGYGGTKQEAKKVTNKSNDGGIDGVINDDRLGLEVIYLQAKRWDKGTVGRPDVQNFVGALAGQHANKGIFITTSSFSSGAIEYAKSVGQKIILIDGERLVSLMIEFNIGVFTKETYSIKHINLDYFNLE